MSTQVYITVKIEAASNFFLYDRSLTHQNTDQPMADLVSKSVSRVVVVGSAGLFSIRPRTSAICRLTLLV